MATLLDRISRPGELWKAWLQVRKGSSPGSYGPDNITLREFGAQADHHITNLRELLRAGAFRFSLPRGHAIKKKEDARPDDLKAWRAIIVPNIRDRVVQRAILNAIWTKIRDHVCTPGSYGGIRPYRVRPSSQGNSTIPRSTQSRAIESVRRSVRIAAAHIVELRAAGNDWVFETDIIDFYPSIDRRRLLNDLKIVLKDESLDTLLDGAIDTAINDYDQKGPLQRLWDPDRGVPQGGVLSPILANFYLAPLDKALAKSGLQLVRYVDDLVVLCKTREEAATAHERTLEELTKIGLKMHPLNETSANGKIKTRIVEPGASFSFLGLDFTRHAIRPSESRFDRIQQRITEITDVRRGLPLHEVVQSINLRLLGWIQAYRFCSLTAGDLQRIDSHVEKCVRRWLNIRGITERPKSIDRNAFKWIGLRRVELEPLSPILPPRKTRASRDYLAQPRGYSLVGIAMDRYKPINQNRSQH